MSKQEPTMRELIDEAANDLSTGFGLPPNRCDLSHVRKYLTKLVAEGVRRGALLAYADGTDSALHRDPMKSDAEIVSSVLAAVMGDDEEVKR